MFFLNKVILLLIAVYFIVNVLMILIHQLHLFDSNSATASSSSSSLYIFTKIFSSHLMNTTEKKFIPLSYLDTIDQYRSRVPGLTYNLSDTGYITTRNAPHQEKEEEEGKEMINSLHYHKVGDLLFHWHPENVSPLKWIQSVCHPNNSREDGKTGSSSSSSSSSSHQCIPRVDYIHGKAWIHTYRKAEIPFIIYNIPELIATIESNFTIPSLLKNIGGSKRAVEVSHSNRFLYYYTKKPLDVIQKRYPGWLPPQRSMTLSFEEYLRHMAENEELYGNNRHHHREAHDHDDPHDINTDNDVINNKVSLKYLSLFFSKSEMDTDIDNTTTTTTSSSSWVKHSLSILTPANKELFYGNADYRYRGIVCRFSMRGTTGTAHFDSKRNFVAVIRGRRR